MAAAPNNNIHSALFWFCQKKNAVTQSSIQTGPSHGMPWVAPNTAATQPILKAKKLITFGRALKCFIWNWSFVIPA